jgi:hypothetical protein
MQAQPCCPRCPLQHGCVPAVSVPYSWRRMSETARCLARLAGDAARAARVAREIAGTTPATPPSHEAREWQAVLSRHARAIRTTLLIPDIAGRSLQDINTDTDADLVPSNAG